MLMFAFVGAAEVVPLMVFAALVAGIFAVLTAISNRNSRAAERLDRWSRPASLAEIEDPKGAKKERFQGMMETAKALSKPLMPQTELEQSKLKITLANAGFRSDSAVSVYLGIRFGSFMIFFLGSLASFLPSYGLTVDRSSRSSSSPASASTCRRSCCGTCGPSGRRKSS